MKKRLFCFILFPIIIYLIGLPTETVSIPDTNQVVNIPEPGPPPLAVREAFELDPFYQQWIDVQGFPVVASAKVNPYALKEAAWQIWQMIGHRRDVLEVLVEKKMRFSIIAHNELISEIPEYSLPFPDFLSFWARGIGGSGLEVPGHPAVSSSEENILHYPPDDGSYNVLIHEFAHAIHRFGLNTIDPTFDNRLKIAYDAAMEQGLWQGTYASSDRREYWAEGTQGWFHPKGRGSFSNFGTTRSALKAYDPPLAALLAEIYGDTQWRYTPPAVRLNLPYLQGFNPQDSPTFQGFPELEELYQQFHDPNSDDGDNWVDLRPYDPSLIPPLNESRNPGRLIGIGFINVTQADVLLYDVGYDGTERYWTRARPGRVRVTPSRTDVIWLIKDLNGKNLAVFQPVEQVGRAIIRTEMDLITPGLSKVSGDNQAGVSGASLPKPLVIEVRGKNLSVLEGIAITFTVVAGDGTLSVTYTTTNANGQAESHFTLGASLETNTVEVSAAGVGQSVVFNVVPEAAVNIPDPNLRAAVEAALNKAKGDPITPSEMATLNRFEAPERGIINLTGLEYATNLTSLDFWRSSVSDLSPIAGLTNLTFLGAASNKDISDVSALIGLTSLTELFLNGNSISDISPLAGLTNLKRLSLSYNSISDISALSGLTNLTWLKLDRNAITDISALANLTNLRHLELYVNKISDPSPVAGLTDLRHLNLAENSISDISALVNLTNLTYLELPFNSISNLSPLVANTGGLGRGDEVDVRGNPLSYLSIMAYIPALQRRGVTVEFDDSTAKPPDVNSDGNVNVLDLVLIASELGNEGTNIPADVDGNGVVDILDLVSVAGMFEGAAAAAPSTQLQAPETLTAVEVQDWLTDARSLEVKDITMNKGIMVLEQLLAALTPTETELLANYPNPFNPETWIPYRLAEDALVALIIYDRNGHVVRTLDVGHRIASAYESRSKAVHWDGKNELGESVVSGIYFYTLTAGEYSATRKMLILK